MLGKERRLPIRDECGMGDDMRQRDPDDNHIQRQVRRDQRYRNADRFREAAQKDDP